MYEGREGGRKEGEKRDILSSENSTGGNDHRERRQPNSDFPLSFMLLLKTNPGPGKRLGTWRPAAAEVTAFARDGEI